MRTEILNYLDNPAQLEKLYRGNKAVFKKEFNSVYPEIGENTTARIWNERLNFESDELSLGSNRELGLIAVLVLVAGLIVKLPLVLGMEPDYFYQRNAGFILFPFLTIYFVWKQKLDIIKPVAALITMVISAIYINALPGKVSDTLILACIHMPLFLWSILGYTFTGFKFNAIDKRIDFLRYNGELVIISTLFAISGGLLIAISVGLFELIGVKLDFVLQNYVLVWGIPAAPIIGTFIVMSNPQLVNKVSPVIAKVFTPLVLFTLTVYLTAVIYTGKDPYNDREFLLIFNILLIGVMAIILFSIAGTSRNSQNKLNTLLLLLLSIVTIIINCIALSAILFRISEWGVTPNRLAVLGGNVLMLTHLLIVTYRLFQTIKNPHEISNVERGIATFLPVYMIWTVVVTFGFPLFFSFS